LGKEISHTGTVDRCIIATGPKNKKIEWKDEHEQAFKALKKMVSKEEILAYPDWTQPFVIHTDTSDYQLARRCD